MGVRVGEDALQQGGGGVRAGAGAVAVAVSLMWCVMMERAARTCRESVPLPVILLLTSIQ